MLSRLIKKEKNEMIRAVKNKLIIPRTTQDTIPFQAILSSGIIALGDNKYSQIVSIGNINYTLARQDDRESIFYKYSEFLNSLGNEVEVQIFINNVKLNKKDFMESVFIDSQGSDFKELAEEFNEILGQKIDECHNKTALKELFFVFTIKTLKEDLALELLNVHINNAENYFKNIGCEFNVLSAAEVIRLFYNFYNPLSRNRKDYLPTKNLFKTGISVKDIISPNSFKFRINHYNLGAIVGRTLCIRTLPSQLKDTLLSDILEFPFTMNISLHIEPTDSSKAITNIKRRITSMEANKIQYTRKAGLNLNPYIPYELKNSIQEANELLDAIINKNKKLFYVSVYINVFAGDIESLDDRTTKIQSVCRKHLVNCMELSYQQEDGLCSILPIGKDKVNVKRALLTDSTAVFMPFGSQEIIHEGGFYYGVNKISKSLIILNRKLMENPAGFYVGKPRSGKSFKSKYEIVNILLRTNDDVLVIDPEGEFTRLNQNFGGEVIKLAPNSTNFLNALEITEDYGLDDIDPISAKADFVLSLFETISGKLSAIQKTIIDRCVKKIYAPYVASQYDPSKIPTLIDLYNSLKEQEEVDANRLAVELELYTKGSLNIFSKKTNVELNNRFTVFNVADLKKQLKTLGMLITCDFIWNRLCKNFQEGKNTWVFIDEFQTFYGEDCSYIAEFFNEFFRRSQKRGGIPTGITQNIQVILAHEKARIMLSNSELLLLFKQSPSDREELARLLKITPIQMSHIIEPKEGEGLMIMKGKTIPFFDKLPKESKLYKMMTTKVSDIFEEREGQE